MAEEVSGLVYDIQAFSVQDGPGIRTTVFLKGCPLRCPWCHSPESQAFYPQISWISMRCVGTEICEESCLQACTKKALEPGAMGVDTLTQKPIQYVHVDRKLCDNCGDCAKECYPKALYVCGTRYTVEEIMAKVRPDKAFFERSGGGVTVSGGEALSQSEFTIALLKQLKAEGFHTALDTTGFASWDIVEKTLPYADLYLYDLKHMDNEMHQKTVGVPNEIIKENAKRIAAAGGKMQIRIPTIPMFNDSEENMRATAEFVKALGPDAVTVVQLLPYHNLGVTKHLRISDEIVFEATPPSDEKMEKFKKMFIDMGIPATIH